MRNCWLFLLIVMISCQPTQKEETTPEENSSDETEPQSLESEKQYDYKPLFGIYDHGSTTKSFGAVVLLSQNGLDLYFTISSVQGACKAETEGVIVMVEHTETFYTGFANIENCPLQFTFYPAENKVDIKEVTLCTIHGSTCSFEGMYVQRKAE